MSYMKEHSCFLLPLLYFMFLLSNFPIPLIPSPFLNPVNLS